MVGVDPGPPNGAVKGRWRFRPPCVATTPSDKGCTPPPAGTFLPPTREVRAVIEGAWAPGQTRTAANGIIWGQYHAPILEYIFPENIPGTPVVPNNFESLAFLKGGYTSAAGTLVGQLNPWPNVAAPAPTCSLPAASAGGPYSVVTTGTVTLAATATGTGPFTFSWAWPGAGTLSNLAIANPVYTAPLAAQLVPLSLTVTNGCGSVTVSSAVVVNTPGNPTINSIAPVTVFSGAPVSMTATGTDPNGLALTYSWLQTASTGPIVLAPNPFTGATVSFAAPTLPLGQITNDVLNFQVSAKDSAGAAATPVTTSVTVKPLPDALSITLAEYRTGKSRLTVNATSSVISPNVVLTLQPYTTTTGTVFDPASIGATLTNNGGGLYIIDMVGAPQPASGLVVKSNLGGASAPHVLDRIRL